VPPWVDILKISPGPLLYSQKDGLMEFPNIYKGDYRKLVILPLIIVLIASLFMFHVQPGLELKGGVLVTLQLDKPMTDAEVMQSLAKAGFNEVNVRTYELSGMPIAEVEIAHNAEMVRLEAAYKDFLNTYDKYSRVQYEIVVLQGSNGSTASLERDASQMRQHMLDLREELMKDASTVMGKPIVLSTDVDALKPEVQALYTNVTVAYRANIMSELSKNLHYSAYSFKLINPSLSEIFVTKIEWVMVVAALLSAVAVFIIFRDFVPSVAVLCGATFDIIFALGFMGIAGIPLSLAAIASLLMLIGFSLDTDILLTVRILKRGLNDPHTSAYEAMKTGLTMSLSAILAFSALFVVGQLTNIATYQDISKIVLAGLFGDIIGTWFLNAVIMIYHVEKGVKSAGFVVR